MRQQASGRSHWIQRDYWSRAADWLRGSRSYYLVEVPGRGRISVASGRAGMSWIWWVLKAPGVPHKSEAGSRQASWRSPSIELCKYWCLFGSTTLNEWLPDSPNRGIQARLLVGEDNKLGYDVYYIILDYALQQGKGKEMKNHVITEGGTVAASGIYLFRLERLHMMLGSRAYHRSLTLHVAGFHARFYEAIKKRSHYIVSYLFVSIPDPIQGSGGVKTRDAHLPELSRHISYIWSNPCDLRHQDRYSRDLQCQDSEGWAGACGRTRISEKDWIANLQICFLIRRIA